MKNMNYLLLMGAMLLGISCSDRPTTENELKAVSYSANENEGNAFMELYLHQHSLETTLTELNCQKEFLISEIEAGNEELLPELEQVQMGIEQHSYFYEVNQELLLGIRCPTKKCPRPKPNPCGDLKGCALSCPIRMPEDRLILWVPGGQEGAIDITLVTFEGEPCGEVVDMYEVEGGENLVGIVLESNGCNDGFIEVRKEYEYAEGGSILYRVPISND